MSYALPHSTAGADRFAAGPKPAAAKAADRPRRESADALLAKNLVVARVVTGMTQTELASAAGISRATIAQLESGYSDPRLSTVVDLAAALGIPPMLLLVGLEEVIALAALRSARRDGSGEAISIPEIDLAKMLDYVETGMLKDRLRAARIGAAVARRLGHPSPMAPVAAGILSAILPGRGTLLGAALGELLPQPK